MRATQTGHNDRAANSWACDIYGHLYNDRDGCCKKCSHNLFDNTCSCIYCVAKRVARGPH